MLCTNFLNQLRLVGPLCHWQGREYSSLHNVTKVFLKQHQKFTLFLGTKNYKVFGPIVTQTAAAGQGSITLGCKMFEVFDDFSSEMAVCNKWDRNILFPAPPCPSGILISMTCGRISVILLFFFLGLEIHPTSNHSE